MKQKRKEARPFFWKALIIAGVILIANIAFISYTYRGNFTGYAVSDGIEKTYASLSFISKVLFISQWCFIFLALVITLFRDSRMKKHVKEVDYIKTKKLHGGSSTDLDSLYSVLQEKKQLKISTISKAFNIDDDKAMEWCKILESGNLAVIDYPGVGEPVIKKAA